MLAILLCERPSYFSFKRGNIKITQSGKLRGHSEFIKDDMGNVQVATNVDGHQFKKYSATDLYHIRKFDKIGK